MNDDDFFEEDEPVEKVRLAFERGEKGLTERPNASKHLAPLKIDPKQSKLKIEDGRLNNKRVA